MQNAPAYAAERFPGDFATSAVCGLVTAALLGPAAWWLARRYLQRTYPHHPEMFGAAVVTGLLDGLLLAFFAFIICFAVRIWSYERRERKLSDAALRKELQAIFEERDRGSGESPLPHL